MRAAEVGGGVPCEASGGEGREEDEMPTRGIPDAKGRRCVNRGLCLDVWKSNAPHFQLKDIVSLLPAEKLGRPKMLNVEPPAFPPYEQNQAYQHNPPNPTLSRISFY